MFMFNHSSNKKLFLILERTRLFALLYLSEVDKQVEKLRLLLFHSTW